MTEFSHSPIKKITIQQMVQVTLEEFKERLLRVPGAGHAKWIDGILFVHYSPKDADEVVHNELQGNLFWNYFEFCKCEQIPPPIKNSYVEIPIMDVSKHETFQSMAAWLKAQPIWSDCK